MDRVKVLVVDDHPLARQGIAILLEEDPIFEIVGEAGDGEDAIRMARELQPDLVLMDIHLPGCDGFVATQRIKAEHPAVRIVMVTVSDDVQNLFEAIKNGAQGYLLKNLSPEIWIEYLKAVVGGEAPISKRIAKDILNEFTREEPSETEPALSQLSEREREVLVWVAKGSSNKEIAEVLSISENTVKNHLKNILGKLHLRNRVQLATYAVSAGLTVLAELNDDRARK